MDILPKKGEYVINFNTWVFMIGLAFSAGVNYMMIQGNSSKNSDRITGLEKQADGLAARISVLETTGRTLDNHELRISSVERQATDTVSALRSVEQSLNVLASDARLTREIVSRIERSQNGEGGATPSRR